MRRIIPALALGCLTLGHAQTKDYTFVYDSNTLLGQGTKLHDEGKYSDALKLYETIAEIDPEYWRAQYEKTLSYNALEQTDKAREIYEQAYASGLMRNQVDFLMGYGSFLSNQKEYEKSEQIFKEAEKLSPNYGSLLYNMSLLYLRKEDIQKCIDYAKKSITYNPQHAGSHYLLGAVAFDQGRIVEGSVALAAYLMLAPDGGVAEKSILKINAKFGENYLEKGKAVFSASGDDFEEIEVILRNQLPLKDAYKIQSDFDDPIIRQLQAIAEYATTHKQADGFFETMYFPWLADMFKKKQFEGFSYYILASMEEKLGKKLSSKKKKIQEFMDAYVAKDYWPLFAKRKLEIFGQQREVVVYLRNGNPWIVGTMVDGKKQGNFMSLFTDWNLAGNINLKDDQLDGLQKYYDHDGTLNEETTFKMGERDGKSTAYFSNGNLKSVEHYKNGKRHGLSTSYFVNGGVDCEINFTDGLKDGDATCFFEGGQKKSVLRFGSDKITGVFQKYNPQGALLSETNYNNGILNGKYTEYYDGKLIKTQADYKDDNVTDTFKRFYGNGTVSEEYKYVDGLQMSSTHNSADGVKSYEARYDKKGNVENYTYYDNSGVVYYEENYKAGKIKSGLQYEKGKAKPTETDVNKKGEIIKNLSGNTLVDGRYVDGNKNGEWKGFYFSGAPQYTESFRNGRRQGMKYTFKKSGHPNEIMYYDNDTLNGLCETFENGKLKYRTNFRKGERHGPAERLYADGSVEQRNFYENGEIVKSFDYFQNGNLKIATYYDGGDVVWADIYSFDGKKEERIAYKGLTGKFTHKYHSGCETHEFEMKNGVLNGKYITKDKSGQARIEGEYVSGKRINRYAQYGVTGAPLYEINFYNGLQHGPGSYYDPAGKLRLTANFLFGEDTGKVTKYYCNRTKMYEYNEFENLVDGEMKYFDHQGKEILALGFKNNELMYYRKLEASGALGDQIPVVNETAKIASVYANGKTAISLEYVRGNLEGKLLITNAEGKTIYDCTYKNDKINGVRTEYFPNGQLYKKENFIDDDFEGISEYFNEDGKPLLSITMKNDELHGPAKFYKAGKLIAKTYDSNVLVDVK